MKLEEHGYAIGDCSTSSPIASDQSLNFSISKGDRTRSKIRQGVLPVRRQIFTHPTLDLRRVFTQARNLPFTDPQTPASRRGLQTCTQDRSKKCNHKSTTRRDSKAHPKSRVRKGNRVGGGTGCSLEVSRNNLGRFAYSLFLFSDVQI